MCARVKVKFGRSPIRVERPMTLDYTILAVDLVVEMVRLDKHGICFELPSTSRSSALALCCRRNGENAYLQMKDQRYSSLCLDHVRVLFWTNITGTNGLLNWTIQMWKICCICHVQCQIHGSIVQVVGMPCGWATGPCHRLIVVYSKTRRCRHLAGLNFTYSGVTWAT